MKTRDRFRALLKERRQYPPHSDEWTWRTRAARKLAWIMMRVPVNQWSE